MCTVLWLKPETRIHPLVDSIHTFKTLEELEVLTKERLYSGMHYIQQYCDLAVALTEIVYGYITPDVSSVVNTLEGKVRELMAQGE